jgi:Cro/C1-type HTH DNA-binding domain
MVHAFSQLKRVLRERKLSVPQLQRRLEEHGLIVNLKSLYRLTKDDQPLERLNLRVAGMICQVCDVPLSKLIAFESAEIRLHRLSAAKQKRLDALMDRSNQGRLTSAECTELKTLVRDAEEISLSNARKLASQRRSLASLHTDENR